MYFRFSDVIFSHDGSYGMSYVGLFLSGEMLVQQPTPNALTPKKFC